jgi:hypothetical protein
MAGAQRGERVRYSHDHDHEHDHRHTKSYESAPGGGYGGGYGAKKKKKKRTVKVYKVGEQIRIPPKRERGAHELAAHRITG